LTQDELKRARGALLGLAVGDALGTTLEFSRPPAPAFPALAQGPHRDISGGGPFRLAPGEVTDDTQMAACLASSLRARGVFDAADVAARYLTWKEVAFDVGGQTADALARIAAGASPHDAGHAVWAGAPVRRRPAGNGSLMRTAPIGVVFRASARERRRASLADSALTHFDPRCQLACAALNGAVAAAVLGWAGDARGLAASARHELIGAERLLLADERMPPLALRAARADLERDLERAAAPDPELYGPELHLHDMQGFVRVAFRLAFWEAHHAPSFEEGLVDVVNRGGDADTNGAIAGALLGAFHGEDGIPARWREAVLAAAGRAGPLGETCHPKNLLALVGPP
jgi:ADP-ribosylglycohydrolase